MGDDPPRLHHVVFAVAGERFEQAGQFLSDLGFRFETFELADVGLREQLDWERGIELVTPVAGAEVTPNSVADFLAKRGDGVFSVVVRVAGVDAAEELARRYGAQTRYRHHRDTPWFGLDEAQLGTLFGMPLTFLALDPP